MHNDIERLAQHFEFTFDSEPPKVYDLWSILTDTINQVCLEKSIEPKCRMSAEADGDTNRIRFHIETSDPGTAAAIEQVSERLSIYPIEFLSNQNPHLNNKERYRIMNTALENLKKELDTKAMEDMDTNSDNYIEASLTDEDRDAIEKMKREMSDDIVVVESGEDGQPVRQSLSSYAESLDKKQVQLDENKYLKMLNSGEIAQSVEDIKKDTQERAMKAYREMAILGDRDMTDEEIIDLNVRVIDSLCKAFGIDTPNANIFEKRLQKMSLQQIAALLPAEYVTMYVRAEEVKINSAKAKAQLIAAIAYLCVTGPEMDMLNQYIDDETRLSLVSKRLLQCQLDFSEVLRSDERLSELVARSNDLAPVDDSFWSRYIAIPNRVHNEFAQRYVIQEEYKKAYTSLLDDYPVATQEALDSITDPEAKKLAEHENTLNARAVKMINDEIEESAMKMEVYQSIMDLYLLRVIYKELEDQYINHTKVSLKFLTSAAITSVDRAKRSKVDVTFPGFTGKITNEKVLFSNYMVAYPVMVKGYNAAIAATVASALKDEAVTPETETTVNPILIEGISPDKVAQGFSIVLLILMGRIMKALTKKAITKSSAIELDAYYHIFCKLGTDIYTMSEIWDIIRPLVKHICENVTFPRKW